MSGREISVRVTDLLLAKARRAGFFVADKPPEPQLQDSSSWLGGVLPEDSDRYVQAADRVIEGNVDVFSLECEFGARCNWNQDPSTGTVAPTSFGPAIDVHSRATIGDIKYLWEVNRHLDLAIVAQAFEITGDSRYSHGVKSILQSWFDQCPYLKGPNWASSLELAIRLINWSVAWQILGGNRADVFDGLDGKKFRDRWLRSIYQHTHFINGHYSGFSSANNHLTGEASGVFIASSTWPFWPEFENWQKKARKLLIQAAVDQVGADGAGREQAVSYQQFVLDFLIMAGLAARGSGMEFPAPYWQTIERMLEFIMGIMDARGNVPMIGDADDGYVVRLSQEPNFCPFKSLLASGAILFDRPDFAVKAGKLDDKTRYLLGGEGFSDLLKSDADLGKDKRRQFPDGGYFILGQRFSSDREIFLLADAGPLGYLSIAAHGHADALAVYLSVAGREFLVDPGTYTYHGDPEWRAYFRGTRAHNTVVVDAQDQSQQGGPFLWTRHAKATCTSFEPGEESDRLVAEHDGYKRLDDPVVHRREIARSGCEFEVVDTLECRGSHAIERCWHFSEDCDVSVEGASVIAENNGLTVRIVAEDPSTRIVCLTGSENPIGGWVSRRFDKKVPSTSVYFADDINSFTVLRARISCRFA
jgi:hypothetical protein